MSVIVKIETLIERFIKTSSNEAVLQDSSHFGTY